MEENYFSHQRIIRLQSKTTPGGATRCLGAILSRAQDRKKPVAISGWRGF